MQKRQMALRTDQDYSWNRLRDQTECVQKEADRSMSTLP